MRKRNLIPPALRKPRRTGRRSGAPLGNRNAYKHGRFTRERRALYADIRAYIAEGRALMAVLSRACLIREGFIPEKTLSSPAEARSAKGKGTQASTHDRLRKIRAVQILPHPDSLTESVNRGLKGWKNG